MRMLLARLLTASVLLLAPQLLLSAEERIRIVANDAARRVDVTDRRPAVHVVHLSDDAQEAGAVSAADGTGHARHARVSARAARRRAGRSPASRRVSGSTTATSTGSISGTTRTRSVPSEPPKMGTILHRRVVEAKSGADRGELAVESDWVDPDSGTALLREAHALRLPRREGHAQRRPHHDADRRRAASSSRTTKKACSACASPARSSSRRTSPKSSAMRRASRRRCQARQHRRHRDLHEQRRAEGRRRVGHARAWTLLQGTVGRNRDLAMLDHPGNPGSHLLARARLRPVRGQPAGPKSLRRQTGRTGDHARAGPVGHVPPSRADSERHVGTRGDRARVSQASRSRLGPRRSRRVLAFPKSILRVSSCSSWLLL